MSQKLSACTSILIGKKASRDGSIMIGRNEDAKASLAKTPGCSRARRDAISIRF